MVAGLKTGGRNNSNPRRILACLLTLLLIVGLAPGADSRSPYRPRKFPDPPPLPYTDAELNIIANIVDGEVGGITGSVTVVYADGTVAKADGTTLRQIHARVVHNQVRSELFPDTVRSCANLYWSSRYSDTSWRSSERWQRSREDAVFALLGFIDVPDNVFAATCDPYFSKRYPGYRLWAKVRWSTGWVSGAFYYYAYDP